MGLAEGERLGSNILSQNCALLLWAASFERRCMFDDHPDGSKNRISERLYLQTGATLPALHNEAARERNVEIVLCEPLLDPCTSFCGVCD